MLKIRKGFRGYSEFIIVYLYLAISITSQAIYTYLISVTCNKSQHIILTTF